VRTLILSHLPLLPPEGYPLRKSQLIFLRSENIGQDIDSFETHLSVVGTSVGISALCMQATTRLRTSFHSVITSVCSIVRLCIYCERKTTFIQRSWVCWPVLFRLILLNEGNSSMVQLYVCLEDLLQLSSIMVVDLASQSLRGLLRHVDARSYSAFRQW